MPHDGLAGFRVRCDRVGIYGWYNHTLVGDFRRVAAIAADDPGDPGAYAFGVFQSAN